MGSGSCRHRRSGAHRDDPVTPVDPWGLDVQACTARGCMLQPPIWRGTVTTRIEPGSDRSRVLRDARSIREPAAAYVDEVVVADAVPREVLRLVRLIERTRAHFAAGRTEGVEHAAYVLLAHLTCVGPVRASALAESVHPDPSAMSRQPGRVRAGVRVHAPVGCTPSRCSGTGPQRTGTGPSRCSGLHHRLRGLPTEHPRRCREVRLAGPIGGLLS